MAHAQLGFPEPMAELHACTPQREHTMIMASSDLAVLADAPVDAQRREWEGGGPSGITQLELMNNLSAELEASMRGTDQQAAENDFVSLKIEVNRLERFRAFAVFRVDSVVEPSVREVGADEHRETVFTPGMLSGRVVLFDRTGRPLCQSPIEVRQGAPIEVEVDQAAVGVASDLMVRFRERAIELLGGPEVVFARINN